MATQKCNKSEHVPAVGYLRKSTAGQSNGKQRQEKSISQQRQEIETLAKKHGYKIVRWYSDEGVSGWKRNGKRPGFDQMIADAKQKGDFAVIICDDLDRFSRAEVMEVFSDLSTLASAGVSKIHCVNQGKYGLGENDIGRIIKMVVDVHGGNEYSRKLGRRIALARRNKAAEGRRSGGLAPYGMKNDGNGGLIHSDPKAVKTVKWIFDQFVNKNKSLNWISAELNRQNTPSPRSGKWAPQTLTRLIAHRAYCGDFTFGGWSCGRFHHVNENGEVVESNGHQPSGKPVFTRKGLYEPIIDASTFGKAQSRLQGFKTGRKPQHNGYALSRVLVCDHCGQPMYGTVMKNLKGSPTVYRCSAGARRGADACRQYTIRESQILPPIMRMLGEEIENLSHLLDSSSPPKELTEWAYQQEEKNTELESEIEAIKGKIDTAAESLMSATDKRTRQMIDEKIKGLWAEHDRLAAELDSSQPDEGWPCTEDDVDRLLAWYDDFEKRAVRVPLNPEDNPKDAAWWAAAEPGKPYGFDCDRRAVNEALHLLGCEVRLRWRAKKIKVRNTFVLEGGRFRLGQRTGQIAQCITDSTLLLLFGFRSSRYAEIGSITTSR